jgi:hypothetical protein
MRVKGPNCSPKEFKWQAVEELKGGDVHFLFNLPFLTFSLDLLSLVTHFISSLHCPVDPGSREMIWDIWDIWDIWIFGYLDIWILDISIFPRYLNWLGWFGKSEISSLVLILIRGLKFPALTWSCI